MPAGSVDVCFISTVLHIYKLEEIGTRLFSQIRDPLKPGGRVAILECKKEDAGFGPPVEKRHSPEAICDAVAHLGFREIGLVDLGYNYLIQFSVVVLACSTRPGTFATTCPGTA